MAKSSYYDSFRKGIEGEKIFAKEYFERFPERILFWRNHARKTYTLVNKDNFEERIDKAIEGTPNYAKKTYVPDSYPDYRARGGNYIEIKSRGQILEGYPLYVEGEALDRAVEDYLIFFIDLEKKEVFGNISASDFTRLIERGKIKETDQPNPDTWTKGKKQFVVPLEYISRSWARLKYWV